MDWETTSSDADTECNGGARATRFKQLALYLKSVAASSPFWCQHSQLKAEVAASIASFVGPKETAEADRQSCFQFKTSIHCKMEEDRCWMILIDRDAVLEASNGPHWQLDQLASEYNVNIEKDMESELVKSCLRNELLKCPQSCLHVFTSIEFSSERLDFSEKLETPRDGATAPRSCTQQNDGEQHLWNLHCINILCLLPFTNNNCALYVMYILYLYTSMNTISIGTIFWSVTVNNLICCQSHYSVIIVCYTTPSSDIPPVKVPTALAILDSPWTSHKSTSGWHVLEIRRPNRAIPTMTVWENHFENDQNKLLARVV